MKFIKVSLLVCFVHMYASVSPAEHTGVVSHDEYVMPDPALIDAYLKLSTAYGNSDFNQAHALEAVFASDYTAWCNGEQIVTSRAHLQERLEAFKKDFGSWTIEIISAVPCTETNCPLSDKTCWRIRKFWTLPGKVPMLIELFMYSKDGRTIHKVIETASPVLEEQLKEVRNRLLQD